MQAQRLKWRFYSEHLFMPRAHAPTAARADAIAPPASYEAALLELEQLVAQLESGQLPLEQLLAGYQRGALLLAFCKDRLQAVEDQIKVLDESGLKPWAQE
jgi:exodeoxyribonuclease VII small subunit